MNSWAFSWAALLKDSAIYLTIVRCLLNDEEWVNKFSVNSAFILSFSYEFDPKIFKDLNLIDNETLEKWKPQINTVFAKEALAFSNQIFQEKLSQLFYFPLIINSFYLLFGFYTHKDSDLPILDNESSKYISISNSVEASLVVDNLAWNNLFMLDMVYDFFPEDYGLFFGNKPVFLYNTIKGYRREYFYKEYTNAVLLNNNTNSIYTYYRNVSFKAFSGLDAVKNKFLSLKIDKDSEEKNKLSLDNFYLLYTRLNVNAVSTGGSTTYHKQLAFLDFLDQQWFEYFWAFIPSVIISQILFPSLVLLYSVEDPNIDPKLSLKIVGHQWYWEYEYQHWLPLSSVSNDDIFVNFKYNYDSNLVQEDNLELGQKRLLEVDKHVILPIHVPIRLLMTSADVLHSWAMPELGIKVDCVPGRINNSLLFITRPGVFYGQCSELCGVNHGFMPIVLDAIPYSNFKDIFTIPYKQAFDEESLDII